MGSYSEYMGVIEGSYRVLWGLTSVLVSSFPRCSKILSLLFKVFFGEKCQSHMEFAQSDSVRGEPVPLRGAYPLP